ncbi:MAG TPA: hypothetical protein DCL77_18855 [Prolixibacteraceae bacterium]|jgi:hypothetical protein|nr:hypothetical protein [Prolixibacteraceae bacterium]
MKKISTLVAILFMAITFFNSCQKLEELVPGGGGGNGHLQLTKTYSSEVAFKWMDLQMHLMLTNPTPVGGTPSIRLFAYPAIAMYESVVPGMSAYRSLSGQLTDMPAMPSTVVGAAYSWPVCANSALAAMSRDLFSKATDANKAKIDSLEKALNDSYLMLTDTGTFGRSVKFGKAVADLVFNWSLADKSADANAPYTLPVGPGLWKPTPPAFAPASVPYWGKNRLMVSTSLDGIDPVAPPVYSIDPNSDYYKMMKEVHDASLTLTDAQKAVAIFYAGKPGSPNYGGGAYLSTLKQVLVQENPQLDFTAYAFAKVSIAMMDAGVGVYKVKYQYNQERPVTFIREVLGDATWTSFVVTPPFPDFPSSHSTLAGSFAETLEGLLGTNYHYTDHTYDFQGEAPRSYTSFEAMVLDIGDARFFGGIHSRYSCTEGAKMGRKIAQNINNTLKFKK